MMLLSRCRYLRSHCSLLRFSTLNAASVNSTPIEKNRSPFVTVGSLLTSAVDKFPHKEVIRGFNEKKRYSYQELYQASRELANGFMEMGVEQGNTVALWMSNRTENYIIQLAAMMLGVRIAQIDTQITSPKGLHNILQETNARVFVYSGSINEQRVLPIIRQAIPELDVEKETHRPLRSKTLRKLQHVYSTDFDIDDLTDEQLENHYEKEDIYIPIIALLDTAYVGGYEPRLFEKASAKVKPETPAVAVYTSEDDGETPKKIAEYTHQEICEKSKQMAKELSLQPDDKICITKLTQGFSLAPFAAFYSNSQIVLPSFDENHEYIEEAMKIEGCKITGRDLDNYQRL